MTPEDTNRIVDAIDRNTEAVERQTEWLKLEEVDPSLEVLQDIRNWLKATWLVIVVMAVIWMFITPAKATPLLPPLDQPVIVEIGMPPLPPPNPHLQYWHTQYVPGPDGVLPVEVFAPRLVAQVASDAEVVDVPEPTTTESVFFVVIMMLIIGWLRSSSRGDDLHEELREKNRALLDILSLSKDEDIREVARKALEDKQ